MVSFVVSISKLILSKRRYVIALLMLTVLLIAFLLGGYTYKRTAGWTSFSNSDISFSYPASWHTIELSGPSFRPVVLCLVADSGVKDFSNGDAEVSGITSNDVVFLVNHNVNIHIANSEKSLYTLVVHKILPADRANHHLVSSSYGSRDGWVWLHEVNVGIAGKQSETDTIDYYKPTSFIQMSIVFPETQKQQYEATMNRIINSMKIGKE